MKSEIDARFVSLVQRWDELVRDLPRDSHGTLDWVPEAKLPVYQGWLSSACNLIKTVARPDSHFVEEYARLVSHRDMQSGISSLIVQKMHGLLLAAKDDWDHGFLRQIEYIVAAETFDDFLDHASTYHRGGKKVEASVLASAVLEDSVKRVAHRHAIPSDGRSLDPLIDDLGKAGVFTPVKVKRLKAMAAVRNHALHAEWDKVDLRDVGNLIEGIRGVLEEYL